VKVGDLVRMHDDYLFQHIYGFGVVTEITHRDEITGRARRVMIKWQKITKLGNCEIYALRLMNNEGR
jgi:hypothetical protein